MILPESFVDTSAWFELFTQENAQRAAAFSKIWWAKKYQFVTSDFVIDELFTLLRSRRFNFMTAHAWNVINDADNVKRLTFSREDVDQTFALFQKFSDKKWSFTDCSSYLLIKRHAIPFACAFNGHFKEFGIVTVLP